MDRSKDINEVGGGVGGLKRGKVPHIVENLLESSRGQKLEIKIRPEIIARYYSVEWRNVEPGSDE